MPTVEHVGPYRFFFYSSDRNEPRHIHVERDNAVAKLWLEPVSIAYNYGFSNTEMNKIERITVDSVEPFCRATTSTEIDNGGAPRSSTGEASGVPAARIQSVAAARGHIMVFIDDGRRLLVPLDWYPRLANADPMQLAKYRLIGGGLGVHWPDIDEDIELRAILTEGQRSNESHRSLLQHSDRQALLREGRRRFAEAKSADKKGWRGLRQKLHRWIASRSQP